VAFRAARNLLPADVLAKQLVKDPSPAVRREVAISLRDVPYEKCGDLLTILAKQVDPGDRYAVEAFGIAADRKEELCWQALAGPDRAAWTPWLGAMAFRLHPKAAIPTLEAWTNDRQLSREAREQAITALAFIKDRAAADAMLALALAGPDDTRPLAQYWIRHRDSNDWREYGLGAFIGTAHFEKAKKRWSSGVLRKDTKNLDVDVTGASVLWLVVTDAGDGNACDWSDWMEPRVSGPSGEKELTALPWIEAAAGWGQVNLGKNCSGGPLRVAGKSVPFGIGTHANSRIAYALPPGSTRFLASVGPDDGGVNQPGGHVASVEFQVWTETPPDRTDFKENQRLVTDPNEELDGRKIAAEQLSRDPEGGLFLLHLAEKGTLDPLLELTVAAAIPNNPDLAVRALSTKWFPRPAADGASLPPLPELAAMAGDPARGQAVFLSKAAACVTCHTFRGRGASIGPDLTSIRTKYGKLELLDSILNPSAAIAFGYDTWLVSTKDGRSYCGFLVADSDNLVLKDTQGKRVVIPAKDVDEKIKQKVSAMPEGLALGMTAQQLADLVAFLSEDPNRPPVVGDPIDLWNGRDFTGWTFHLTDPKKTMADVWSIEDGEIVCQGDPLGYLRTTADYTNYVLDVDWRFDPKKGAGNSGVLLRMVGPDKVWPKCVEAQLLSRNAGDIWDIDDFPILVDPARTQGRRTVKLQPCNEKPLGEWNHYEITLNRGELRLVVNGELQNRASWMEEVPGKICLQSEGAVIHFRNIRLRPIR
jgi:putative heme-binding domain-containing protein